jgi:hypothetical protein
MRQFRPASNFVNGKKERVASKQLVGWRERPSSTKDARRRERENKWL